ncbi:MAG TPA: PfkB family carbohydrate kinase [Bacteroidales bacterium]|nr:PfkB family carbohydrate kinase [Bacteroidales bacterium]HPM92676.1 PfkB family carbohydrate kinase [Bacteroidales bacterium]
MAVHDFHAIFSDFQKMKVIVIGDVMIDSYILGRVDRISPEAPVPVVTVEKRYDRLGGAANVALNIKALGAEPLLYSVIGIDERGALFRKMIEDEGISVSGIISCNTRITTSKSRILGNNFQMLRVDEEVTDDLTPENEERLLNTLSEAILKGNVNAIILQDYNKGVLTPKVIHETLSLAASRNVPVAVDPKKKNFLLYRNADLFKPNLKELRDGLGLEMAAAEADQLKQASEWLHNRQGIKTVLVTLSERGVFISRKNGDEPFEQMIMPAYVRKISDVSGAGDTVISVAALALAAGLEPGLLAGLANLAGGLVCEEVGVHPVNRARLLSEARLLL